MAMTGQKNAIDNWPDILATTLRGRRPVLFLDYDGTLSPIVKDPDRAWMSDEMRATLRRAAEGPARITTAIISGRSREKVKAFVQLEGIVYAGSHGFDISGPARAVANGPGTSGAETFGAETPAGSAQETPLTLSVGDRYRPMLERVKSKLESRLANIPGAKVEDNKFALSVHYRNVPTHTGGGGGGGPGQHSPDCVAAEAEAPNKSSGGPSLIGGVERALESSGLVAEVFRVVEACAAEHAGELEVKRGKMVLELRPSIDWNKGSALLWILHALGLSDRPAVGTPCGDGKAGRADGPRVHQEVCPFYLGDDVTDEDAFLALRSLQLGGGGPGLQSPAGSAALDTAGEGTGPVDTGVDGSGCVIRELPGVGVLVRADGDTERPQHSHAEFKVRDPEEVRRLIELIAMAAEKTNAEAEAACAKRQGGANPRTIPSFEALPDQAPGRLEDKAEAPAEPRSNAKP